MLRPKPSRWFSDGTRPRGWRWWVILLLAPLFGVAFALYEIRGRE